MSPEYLRPVEYIDEGLSPRSITADATSVTAFVASFESGPLLGPVAIRNWGEFELAFGGLTESNAAPYAILQFFENGGRKAIVVRIEEPSESNAVLRYKAGMAALDDYDFNLLCLPINRTDADIDAAVHALAVGFCKSRQALYLADTPSSWLLAADPVAEAISRADELLPASPNAVLYFPWFTAPDPLAAGQYRDFPPCGAVAGVFARTDSSRGVWKAPAGPEADLVSAKGPSITISDQKQRLLDPRGVNCLRRSQGRAYIWAARTRAASSDPASQWKYVSVRRLFLFIERSVSRGIDWAVFEPNDERLWAAVRMSILEFLDGLFRQGAFQGEAPRDAYFVKCDRSTMTQDDLDNGRLIVEIGAAPLRPAEFVVISVVKLVRPGEADTVGERSDACE